MIFVGTDLVEIHRIEQAIQRWNLKFLQRIFTPVEREYCDCQAFPAQHYAARFAAKEAVRKAWGAADRPGVLPLNKIEITRSLQGVPGIHLLGYKSPPVIEISITHTHRYASATALLQMP